MNSNILEKVDVMKLLDIEKKIQNSTITEDEVDLIRAAASEGMPRAYFIMGKYELLVKQDEKEAFKWFELFYKKANGYGLFEASEFFASFDDLYIDESMRFLRHAAWRQHPIAKLMYKFMKEMPFELPKA